MAEQIINSYSWNIFINTGYIDNKYLIMITLQIKKGIPLTNKEEAVRREYSQQIEQMLLNTYEK
jgi:hypothetical protein